jgi:hypothetical protein
MTNPQTHYDNLAKACLAKASEFEALANEYGKEYFTKLAAKEREQAILFAEISKGLESSAHYK